MRLVIADDIDKRESSVYYLTTQQFAMKEYHPFLAVQEWERVDIQLGDGIPRGIIRQLIHSSFVVPHYDENNITTNVMFLLCEIAEDDSARLRSAYGKGIDMFKKVLSDVAVKYGW